jgi:hypothetical protein
VTESKFCQCENSGIEFNQGESGSSVVVESCVFEENKNAGLYVAGGVLTVKRCDFVKDVGAGLDLRNCTGFSVEDVLAQDNAGGGYAVAGVQEFGLAIRERSVVSVTNLSVTEGSSPAVYIGPECCVEISQVTIEGEHRGPGCSSRRPS